jgi:hypothetical protein
LNNQQVVERQAHCQHVGHGAVCGQAGTQHGG